MMDVIKIKDKSGKIKFIIRGKKVFEILENGKEKRRKDLDQHEPLDLRKDIK